MKENNRLRKKRRRKNAEKATTKVKKKLRNKKEKNKSNTEVSSVLDALAPMWLAVNAGDKCLHSGNEVTGNTIPLEIIIIIHNPVG